MEQDLVKKSANIRALILQSVFNAGKGHIGGSLSCVDILIALYFGKILNFPNDNVSHPDRDRFILSKGHAGIALYVVLSEMGLFPRSELFKFNKGGMLGEHPDKSIPGVEIDSGALGHGLGVGSGMALAAKIDNKEFHTFVLLGDSECYEGSTWEASLFAAHHHLNNITAILDRNRLIVNGFTEDINKLEPIGDKWKSFGWNVIEIDGHNMHELMHVLQDCRDKKYDKPRLVVANTIKGKGVSFMENQISWHHGGIQSEDYQRAIQELKNMS